MIDIRDRLTYANVLAAPLLLQEAIDTIDHLRAELDRERRWIKQLEICLMDSIERDNDREKRAGIRGARGEREFAEMLSNELGQVVKRKLGQARDGGDDIQVGRFRIEVKRREKLAIEAWCKQVEASCTVAADIAEDGQVREDVPVVVFRRNGEPWRAVVPAKWFIQAMREEL